jgi:hypothetical protein
MISERAFAAGFGSFWSELLPMLTPGFVALVNAAFEISLRDEFGQELSSLPLAGGIERPDIVAEFDFRAARLAHIRNLPVTSVRFDSALSASAELDAFELINIYEGARPTEVAPLSEVELLDGVALCERYAALYAVFPAEARIEFCPTFPGAGFLNTCEGDIRIGDTLIEVKTTKHKPLGKDIRQLIVYLALDANAGRDRWSYMGIFNPRRGTIHRAEIDTLILRLSGGRPRADVFAELISAAESNEVLIESKF